MGEEMCSSNGAGDRNLGDVIGSSMGREALQKHTPGKNQR